MMKTGSYLIFSSGFENKSSKFEEKLLRIILGIKNVHKYIKYSKQKHSETSNKGRYPKHCKKHLPFHIVLNIGFFLVNNNILK